MLGARLVTADTRVVEEPRLDSLREELEVLEAAEARISAERRRLHQQIDFGYSASESLRAREREVSDERRALHRRIDALREQLGLEKGPPAPEPGAIRRLTPELEPEGPQHLLLG
jgi:septal ring factor EnvC (AmiA/AmiB activator)